MEELEDQLKILLLPKDENDDKNVVMEIRAGRAVMRPPCLPRALSDVLPVCRKRLENDLASLNEMGLGGMKEVVSW